MAALRDALRRPAIDRDTRDAVLARDGYRCVACAVRGPLDVHHVEPRSWGGPTTLDNLVALCPGCHAEAHRRIDPLRPATSGRALSRELAVAHARMTILAMRGARRRTAPLRAGAWSALRRAG